MSIVAGARATGFFFFFCGPGDSVYYYYVLAPRLFVRALACPVTAVIDDHALIMYYGNVVVARFRVHGRRRGDDGEREREKRNGRKSSKRIKKERKKDRPPSAITQPVAPAATVGHGRRSLRLPSSGSQKLINTEITAHTRL